MRPSAKAGAKSQPQRLWVAIGYSAGMSVPERYQGRPALLIIENYVLAVIGALSAEKNAVMRDVVQRMWGGGDDWMETVRGQVGWQRSIDDEIHENWIGYQEAAQDQKATGSPDEFAMILAEGIGKDANGSA